MQGNIFLLLDSLFRICLKIFTFQLQNGTACQILANLCTLTLFSSYENSPCNLWLDLRNSINLDNKLPWLIYREGDAGIILNRKKISVQYSLDPLSTVSIIFYIY